MDSDMEQGVVPPDEGGSTMYGAFLGPLGLRAGWGVLLFLVLFAILGTLLFFVEAGATHQLAPIAAQQAAAREKAKEKPAHEAPKTEMIGPGLTVLTENSQALGVLGAAAVMALIERRRFGVFGLPGSRVRDLLPGAFWGLAAMAVLIGLLWASHALVFDGRLQTGPGMLRYGAEWLVVFFFVGLFEEYLFRGYIQYTLMRGMLRAGARMSPQHPQAAAFTLAAVVMSVLFGAVHAANGGETAAGLAGVVLAGVVFSFALWRTGSLWWGIGFHMTWDWSQSFLYGVPDSGNLSVGRLFQTHPVGGAWLSGGVDGPEGSVLMLPVMLGVLAVLYFSRQAPQPPVQPLPPRVPAVPLPVYPGDSVHS
jgi:uncharacterized protein